MNKNQTNNLLTIIKTDKTTKLLENNQYCFLVDRQSNKSTIKLAIEYFFNVKVIKINTCHLPIKKRKVGRFTGYKTHYKKAVVTLSNNNKIDLFTNN